MSHSSFRPLSAALLGAAALVAATLVHADPLSTVQMLREGGCGGVVPAAKPLRHSALLDRAAWQWAGGEPLAAATANLGYRGAASALHLSGPDAAIVADLRRSACSQVADRALQEVGVYQRGFDTWLVMISVPAASANGYPSPSAPPVARDQGQMLAARVLDLVNEARARGARCGGQAFAPAAPLALSGTLGGVASGHARDMAQHNYFEHVDLAGHTPADRVRAVGYREALVGENIAYGPKSVEEVVQGWLDSPGHCANIMDPRFVELGIAWAPGQVGRLGLYWVMELAKPKA
jgi:uncharacterized protein YkwD